MGYLSFYLLKFRFINVLYENLVFGAGRSRAFIGGTKAEIFYLEPKPEKKYLEPEPRKNS